MNTKSISPESLRAFQTLQTAWQGGVPVNITLTGEGINETFQATPEIIQSLKTGLGAEFLGMSPQVNSALRIDETKASEIIGVPQVELRGMVDQYRTAGARQETDGLYGVDDLVPLLAHQSRQEQGQHAPR